MNYVDGFVCAVPTAKREEFIKHAATSVEALKEYGALQVVYCWGDNIPEGKTTSFPMAVKCQADETVAFSWIVWPSSQVRNEAFAKMRGDSRLNPEKNPIPFDGKRIIYGGFEVILEA